jgi:hypothetical protein
LTPGKCSGNDGDGEAGIQDISNLRDNRGNSAFDVRQRFVASVVYELPFGQGKPFGENTSRPVACLYEIIVRESSTRVSIVDPTGISTSLDFTGIQGKKRRHHAERHSSSLCDLSYNRDNRIRLIHVL